MGVPTMVHVIMASGLQNPRSVRQALLVLSSCVGVEGVLVVVRVCVWRGDGACVECNYIHVCTARIGVQ